MVNNRATSFSHQKKGVSGDFLVLSYQFVFFFCFQLFANFLKIAFSKKGCKNWVFQCSVFEVNFLKNLFF